jgi:hypothetical protein
MKRKSKHFRLLQRTGGAENSVYENLLKFTLELPTESFFLGGVGAFTVKKRRVSVFEPVLYRDIHFLNE